MQPIPLLLNYAADEAGDIYSRALRGRQSVPKWRKLRPVSNGKGYLVVSVQWPDGVHRKAYVHRLVLMAFVGSPSVGQQARHLNGVRDDNRPSNLSWGSAADNENDKRRHGTWESRLGGAKLSPDDRIKAMDMRKNGATMQHIADILDVSRPTISRLLGGKTWK